MRSKKFLQLLKSITTEHKKPKENILQINKKKSNQQKDKDCGNPEIVLSDPIGDSKNVKSQSYTNTLTKKQGPDCP